MSILTPPYRYRGHPHQSFQDYKWTFPVTIKTLNSYDTIIIIITPAGACSRDYQCETGHLRYSQSL